MSILGSLVPYMTNLETVLNFYVVCYRAHTSKSEH